MCHPFNSIDVVYDGGKIAALVGDEVLLWAYW